MKKIGYMPLNGGIMGQATGPQPVFLIFSKLGNWQLQSSCDQLRSSPVASLCTSCQLDFETLPAVASKSLTPKLPNITWGEARVQELVSWLVTHIGIDKRLCPMVRRQYEEWSTLCETHKV